MALRLHFYNRTIRFVARKDCKPIMYKSSHRKQTQLCSAGLLVSLSGSKPYRLGHDDRSTSS